MVNTAEMTGTVGTIALGAILAFTLYGPVGVGKSDHNGFVYLFGPWVFPSLIALPGRLGWPNCPFGYSVGILILSTLSLIRERIPS